MTEERDEDFYGTLRTRMRDEKLRLVGFLQELTSESDRGAALVGASVLDDRLHALIRTRLVDCTEAKELLDGGGSPLGSFSSRIKLAFCLGLITEAEHRDCQIIRRVRNDFAHKLTGLTFEDQRIEDLCSSLRQYKYHHPFSTPSTSRRRFEIAVLELASRLFFLALVSPKFKADVSDAHGKLMFVEEAHNWATDAKPTTK